MDFSKGKSKGKLASPLDFLKGFTKPKTGDAMPPKQKGGPAPSPFDGMHRQANPNTYGKKS